MDDLKDLYQEMIVDHYKKPRNFSKLQNATCVGEGFNPLCGDKITLYLKVRDGVIEDVRFEGSGCAISTASASMMTEAIKGKKIEEVESLFGKFHKLLTGDSKQEREQESLGKLLAFKGVSEFPVRVKCATLAWHTLSSVLKGEKKPVSTET